MNTTALLADLDDLVQLRRIGTAGGSRVDPRGDVAALSVLAAGQAFGEGLAASAIEVGCAGLAVFASIWLVRALTQTIDPG
jgi:hypothetical protein